MHIIICSLNITSLLADQKPNAYVPLGCPPIAGALVSFLMPFRIPTRMYVRMQSLTTQRGRCKIITVMIACTVFNLDVRKHTAITVTVSRTTGHRHILRRQHHGKSCIRTRYSTLWHTCANHAWCRTYFAYVLGLKPNHMYDLALPPRICVCMMLMTRTCMHILYMRLLQFFICVFENSLS